TLPGRDPAPDAGSVTTDRGTRVIVGLDGSDESRSALDWAIRAAGRNGSVHAIHAVTPLTELAVAAAQIDSAPMVEHRHADLTAWITPADDRQLDVRRSVIEDDPAAALLRVADDVDADLIVVGVHARSRLEPRTLGRVTTQLVHRTHRPLVVVRPGPDLPLDEGSVVVAGVGNGPATRAALAWAAGFADSHGTALSLIHAIGTRPVFGEDGLLDVVAFYVDRSLLHEWALDDLEQIADELQKATEHEVPISWSSPDGRTGPALVDAGADAGLLVVGRHDGPAGAGRPMTAALHHVLTHAPCPVVVVPVVETDG
ncbi:MAG: universal stress protein, partial [Ilumatobacteraceae bacterium]